MRFRKKRIFIEITLLFTNEITNVSNKGNRPLDPNFSRDDPNISKNQQEVFCTNFVDSREKHAREVSENIMLERALFLD
jgi:hypothetical protein